MESGSGSTERTDRDDPGRSDERPQRRRGDSYQRGRENSPRRSRSVALNPDNTEKVAKHERRRLAVIVAILISVTNIATFLVGGYIGRQGVADQVTNDAHQFQECLFATLYVPQADRSQITEKKLETVCHIDAANVQKIKEELTRP